MKTLPKLLVAGFALLAGSLFAEEKVAPELDGYCPVCYIAAGKAVKGTSDYQAEYEGKTYYFVKQEALDAFNETPEKFLPAYEGYCAYGMALGKKFESDPTVFSVVEGKLYLNKNAEVGKKFSMDTKSLIKKADAEWKAFEMTSEEKAMKEKVSS